MAAPQMSYGAQNLSAVPTKDRNLSSVQNQYFATSQLPTTGTTLYSPAATQASYVSAPVVSTIPATAPIITTTNVVPPVTRGLATVHSERERKVLNKQASKHSKLAAKETRKAEQQAAKAEQLHIKGKDTRAAKYEANAEQHALAAKHHQQWANEAQLMANTATDPSLITTTTAPVYKPAM